MHFDVVQHDFTLPTSIYSSFVQEQLFSDLLWSDPTEHEGKYKSHRQVFVGVLLRLGLMAFYDGATEVFHLLCSLALAFTGKLISLCTWEDQDKIGTLKIINTHYRYTIMYI